MIGKLGAEFQLLLAEDEQVACLDLAIQAGDNPRIVEAKLKAFLSPKIRRAIEAEAALAAA